MTYYCAFRKYAIILTSICILGCKFILYFLPSPVILYILQLTVPSIFYESWIPIADRKFNPAAQCPLTYPIEMNPYCALASNQLD